MSIFSIGFDIRCTSGANGQSLSSWLEPLLFHSLWLSLSLDGACSYLEVTNSWQEAKKRRKKRYNFSTANTFLQKLSFSGWFCVRTYLDYQIVKCSVFLLNSFGFLLVTWNRWCHRDLLFPSWQKVEGAH